MAPREREIIALAFGNLEKTIRSLPSQTVKWKPPLTVHEVATLRRKLTYVVHHGLGDAQKAD